MINEATHGKIVTFTMEGVVLAWSIADWPAAASHAHLEGPHGIQWLALMEGGEAVGNGYLIIIVRGITQRRLAMCKQINLAARLKQARSKVLNGGRKDFT